MAYERTPADDEQFWSDLEEYAVELHCAVQLNGVLLKVRPELFVVSWSSLIGHCSASSVFRGRVRRRRAQGHLRFA